MNEGLLLSHFMDMKRGHLTTLRSRSYQAVEAGLEPRQSDCRVHVLSHPAPSSQWLYCRRLAVGARGIPSLQL